jgi:nucleoside-diphosphate-sugar epimerase
VTEVLVPRVAVTGGSGKLGRAVVRELGAHGWTVHNFDLAPPAHPAGTFTRIELTDYGQVVEALTGIDQLHQGVDAVVHLAAIPGPTHAGNAATFANNLVATYNVFAAARLADIHTIVWASSETLLGYPFDEPPPYVPLDEACPVRPNAAYALAKDLEEEMARQFSRWDPQLQITGLRFSNVMEPGDYRDFAGFDADPQQRKWNLWSYIDARDGASAVRLALAPRQPGFDYFIIANPDTVMSRPSADLMREVFPGTEIRAELSDHQSLLSINKARRVLGFTPAHGWRDA